MSLTLAVAFLATAGVRADLVYTGDDLFIEGYPIFTTGYTKHEAEDNGSWSAWRIRAVDDEHIYGFTVTWDWDAGSAGFDIANVQVNGYASGDGLWSAYTELPDPKANTLYFIFDIGTFLGAVSDNNGRIEFTLLEVADYPLNGSVQFTVWQYPPPADVPEPATLALVGFGLAGLGFARRRMKNNS